MNSTKQLTIARKNWTWNPLRVIPWSIGKLLDLGDWIAHGSANRLLEQAGQIDGATTMLQHGSTSLTIDCSIVSAEDLEILFSLASQLSRELDLTLRKANSDVMPQVARLPGTECLDLSHCDVGDVDLPHLGKLNRLQVLDLSNTRVTDDGLLALHSLKSLESLDVSSTQVTDACLEHLQHLPGLLSVTVENTGISPESMERFKQSSSLNVEFHT